MLATRFGPSVDDIKRSTEAATGAPIPTHMPQTTAGRFEDSEQRSRSHRTDQASSGERCELVLRLVVPTHPPGCPPVAFCGCGAAVEVFGHSVRAHQVMIIRQYLGDGRALAYDANSGGHLTRVYVVSLRGYRIRNPREG
jgi:hypothetical protein